jgi:hypothetical protein
MRVLSRLWAAIREAYFFLKPIRFVVVPLLLLLIALVSADQGQDSIRFLVEVDPRCPSYGRIAVFLLIVFGTALQTWYWSRQMLRIDAVSGSAAAHPDAEKYYPRIFGASVFVIAIIALGRAFYLGYAGGIDYTMRVILWTAAILLLELAAFLAFVKVRRDRMGPSGHVTSHQGFAPLTKWILRGTALAALACVIWTAASPLTFGIVFQSPSLLMLSAAVWIGLGTWLAYWFDLYKIPLATTFLVLAVVFSCWNDNHTVRTLTTADGGGNVGQRKPLEMVFNDWYGRLAQKHPGNPPVFLVATEGGGIRAAYWTAAVLTAIEDQAPQFSDHLFAISSVSGGSVGATVFTALVADQQRTSVADVCENRKVADKSYREAARQVLSYDFLAPTLGSMLHADFVQRFLPVGFIPDRAKALETGWERAWRTRVGIGDADDPFFSSGFQKMYDDHPAMLLPSLFLNGTWVEGGNRMIASNCAFTNEDVPDSIDILSQLQRDLRLSTAAHNSARFTYVSPAGSVHENGGELLSHVVDGGYFENSGAATAGDVIRRIEQLHGGTVPIHLILIKFEEVEAGKDGKPKLLPPPGPTCFINEVASPVRALMNTRSARGTLAYTQAMQMPSVSSYEFILQQAKHGIVLPLGWLMANRTRNAIDLQVGTKVAPEVPDLIKPSVQRNVDHLKAIVQLVSGSVPADAYDRVQRDARASESEAKKK